VCGGLAQYFNTDATLIRVLFVVLALLGGPGLVIYLVLWIVVPRSRWARHSSGAAIHPIPVALTEPHGLQECWLA
jgi:phage shock protein C